MRKWFARNVAGRLYGFCVGLGLVGLGCSHLNAQIVLDEPIASKLTSTPYDLEKPKFEDPAEREKQYQALADEVGMFEKHLGLLRRIVKLVGPSIVHIEASKTTPAGQGFASARVEEAGAGVIVDFRDRLYVLTNRHVIHQAQTNAIRLELNDGRVIHPIKVWTDASTDIAIMEIAGENLVPAKLGDSEKMEIGDFVLAVGSPFGLSHSVSYGIISAKGRRNLELGTREIEIQDFFQTDAAINPGNSGGPLLNLRGEVIGINTAIASNSGGNEGIGFSIPIRMAMLVAGHLIDTGKLPRAYLGVQLDGSFDLQKARQLGLGATKGALIKAVKPESPAEVAGLRFGDVVLEFDKVTIENDGHLLQTAGLTPVGREVEMRVFRSGKMYRVPVTLTEYPE